MWSSASQLEVQSHFHSRPEGKKTDSIKVVEFHRLNFFARMILQNTPGTKHSLLGKGRSVH